MSFGDVRMDAALDRWLTTEPDFDECEYACPDDDCSFVGSEEEVVAHLQFGVHDDFYKQNHPEEDLVDFVD